MDERFKYALPRAEVFLDINLRSLIYNLRNGNPTKATLPSLVQQAYTLVYETGVMPYRDYLAEETFTE